MYSEGSQPCGVKESRLVVVVVVIEREREIDCGGIGC
jgi:hypothetical protein